MDRDIVQRSFEFALKILTLASTLPKTIVGDIVSKQVVRVGTSIGANVEEAQAGFTKEDFIYKNNVALKEARETHYWLRMVKAGKIAEPEHVDPLIDEAEELKKILGAIVSKARGKSKKTGQSGK